MRNKITKEMIMTSHLQTIKLQNLAKKLAVCSNDFVGCKHDPGPA
jgi:hypothetical protein